MNLKFRQATREDLPEIVRMLADDFLGATRERYETPLPESYKKAFEEIAADKNNELIVAENDGEIIGTLQITFTPSISFRAANAPPSNRSELRRKISRTRNRKRFDAVGNRTRQTRRLSYSAN